MLKSPVYAFLVSFAWSLAASAGEVRDFYNVLAPDGADPYVIRHGDGWYYCAYASGGRVALRRSRTLSGLGGGESRIIWAPPSGKPYSHDLWAPEIHHLEGKWYVHVAADDGRNASHRMYALENPSDDPFQGEFTLKGRVFDPRADRWAIDGTVLKAGEKLYFVWSGWEGDVDVSQQLYIAPMSNPWTISGRRVLISRPTFAWEKAAGPPTINEGPEAVVRGGRVLILYSAAGSWSDHYCLGMLWAPVDGDLLAGSTWRKAPEPVFQSGGGVVAPGHASFTTSPDGKEDWIVYHAARHPGAGWARSIRAQPFHWSGDGFPVFGAAIAAGRTIPLPSGEPPRLRLKVEPAARAAGTSPRFTANLDRAGEYVVSVRYMTDSSKRPGPAPRHRLLVDGREAATVDYPTSGAGTWSNAFARVPLRAGANRIELAPGGDRGGGDRPVVVESLDVILGP